ncbi:hypothetical protein IAG44_08925 [Streptomyces roseirectus]|uniref:Uncharacterized protein n=1 Tax=Streptomyces roseirectus TaxID=2768066 RepID=A0A7H0I9U0_9ACTN|nr:hypothetical protein [Streptomyces roseirectus]QNP69556.1 hypothetical protein IAG44_08925 [Streptomyces roseirectus]
MDPVSVALLAALAGGVGGEAGREAWQGLVALVRRPFRRGESGDVSSGEAELDALAAAPGDETRAHVLSTALAVRAALDAEFRRELEEWRQRAERARDSGGTYNTISGGTFHGMVIQSRNTHVRPPGD